MKRILMFGDSWPAGEYKKTDKHDDPDFITHRGIQEYFISNNNVSVLNLCMPGGSNLQSTKRVSDFLLTNQLNDNDIIFFWMTEFFREIWYYSNFENNQITLASQLKKSYTELRDQWVYRPYYNLQTLASRHNTTIYILGGCSDTIDYDSFNEDFPNLQILCQSLTNLIITDNPKIADPVFCQFMNGWVDPFLHLAKEKISNNDQLHELIVDMEKGHQRLDLFKQHKEWFYPDGIHPNRHAHKKIYKYILSQIDI